jgi:hypothetical protein
MFAVAMTYVTGFRATAVFQLINGFWQFGTII